MAEDDDDAAFGDFAFAPFQSNSLFNGLSSMAAAAEEDDEWGDFVQPPAESKQSEAAANGDHGLENSVTPVTWVKSGGALPLSIFGGEEEEEAVKNALALSVDLKPGKSYEIAEGFGSLVVGNGVSNSKQFSIADLYDIYMQIKPESRGGPDFAGKVDSVENGVYSSTNHNTSASAAPEIKDVGLSNALIVRDQSQPTNKSDNEEFSFNSYMSDPSKVDDIFGGRTGEFTGYSSNSKKSPANVLMLSLDLDTNDQKQQLDVPAIAIDDAGSGDDDDDDEWDFKDANSEFRVHHVNNNADFMAHEVSESSPHLSGTGISSMKTLDLFEPSNGSIDFFASTSEPVDYFANSSGISTTSQEVDLIGIQPSSDTLNGFASDEQLIIEQNNVRGLFDQRTDVGVEELDMDFGKFSTVSAETGSEPNELFTNNVLSLTKDVVQIPDAKIEEKDTKLNHHKGAIPLSIFGDEEPESASSSDIQEFFVHNSISSQRSDRVADRVDSIHDMISSLYSQAEQTSSTTNVHNVTETQFNPSSVVSSSNLEEEEEEDDDSPWDFKDASPIEAHIEAFPSSTEDACRSVSSKLDTYLEFYLKLKEELCFVMKHHIDKLKNTQGDVDVFGEGGRASSFDSEFQLACDEMNFVEDGSLQDHHTRESCLKEFAQVLLEPQFQRLESEYNLSQKLLLADKDLGSSRELMRHTNAMLKILNIGTPEEQQLYVSLWSEMIYVCAQELKHGAMIWTDAVVKHVQSQLLSEPQGRKFVLALGEIYRLVAVLGASAKLFKPWVLSGSVDSPSIYILLEECHVVWSTSGLEEALSSVLAPTTSDDVPLLKSIKHILGLDVLELETYVFAEKEFRCRLSLLTAGVVPELKIVRWGNEECFVTLGNLWANLISHEPPKLPQLKNLG